MTQKEKLDREAEAYYQMLLAEKREKREALRADTTELERRAIFYERKAARLRAQIQMIADSTVSRSKGKEK